VYSCCSARSFVFVPIRDLQHYIAVWKSVNIYQKLGQVVAYQVMNVNSAVLLHPIETCILILDCYLSSPMHCISVIRISGRFMIF